MASLLSCLAALLALALPAGAMTVEVHGERIFATGLIGEEGDLQRFSQALAAPGVTELVLVNSPGGQLRLALNMARQLLPRKLRTLVVGRCMSACTILFMAGAQRQFASGVSPVLTMVGFHGAYRRSTREVDPNLQPELFAYYKQRLGAAFDERLFSQALYALKDADGFLRVREVQRNPEVARQAFFCPAGTTPRKDCITHDGKDAVTLGVVTSPETVSLALPETFRPRYSFFGHVLEQEADNLVDTIVRASATMCRRASRCTSQVAEGATRWLEQMESRAFAVGLTRAGYAATGSAGSPLMAAARALYACNHDKESPKLCRLALADRHDLNQYYETSERQSRDALARLEPPAQAAWAGEERGPAPVQAVEPRTARLEDPTPLVLEGTQTLLTAELARQLLVTPRPSLVDVGGAGADMLPGAVYFWNGGLAMADAESEAAYDERFQRMLSLVAPDKAQALVIYADGPDSWRAVNAALRAAKAGWHKVLWYRGGLASWRAAGLPLVQKVPQVNLL